MKKGLLLVSIILASKASFGQLTQANEPAIGASETMYVVDTGAVTLANITATTGSGVEWDYTTVHMDASQTQALSVSDATASPYAAEFPTSTKTMSQGTIVQYFNSTATERVSQGFVFSIDLGMPVEVPVIFDDEATLLTYPFDFGDDVNDTYDGEATIDAGFGPPTTAPVTGSIYTSIDGTGTLKLPTLDIPNVFRLTTIDTATATGVPILNSVEIIRIQHEYYDAGAIGLPIFVDAYIFVSGAGEQRQVLSKNLSTVGLNTNTIENVVLFPNPSAGEFTISGDFAKGTVEVTDLAGRVVYSSEIATGATVKLNDVTSGIYTVKLTADSKTSVQKITIK